MEPQMQSLTIQRPEWGDNKGKLECSVVFKGPHGKVQLDFDEQMSTDILAICADALVRSSQNVAELMTANILESAPVLAPPAE